MSEKQRRLAEAERRNAEQQLLEQLRARKDIPREERLVGYVEDARKEAAERQRLAEDAALLKEHHELQEEARRIAGLQNSLERERQQSAARPADLPDPFDFPALSLNETPQLGGGFIPPPEEAPQPPQQPEQAEVPGDARATVQRNLENARKELAAAEAEPAGPARAQRIREIQGTIDGCEEYLLSCMDTA